MSETSPPSLRTPNSILQRKSASRELVIPSKELIDTPSSPPDYDPNMRKWKHRQLEIFKSGDINRPRRHTSPEASGLHPASLRPISSFACAAMKAGGEDKEPEGKGFYLTGRTVNIGLMLGKGASGAEVYLAESDGFTFAAKVLSLCNVDETIEACKKEIDLLMKLDHKNIVRYLGHEFTKDSLRLYLPYYPATLHDIIQEKKKTNKSFTASQIVNYLIQIAEGLDYLHNLKDPILHRDIKSANVFANLDSNRDITKLQLGDFDVSKILNEKNPNWTRYVGTPRFMAPEVMTPDFEGYNPKIDIWSLGMVWFEMMTLETPYFDLERRECQSRNTSGERPNIYESVAAQYPQFISLWKSCTEASPDKRPSARKLISKLTKMK
eukprot:TRINITY_DN6311_c0_g1_i1.p1 TRINITY_DN6311_c0_g1~~TRINITY_DN6311_c0_g1_i1.p1  ORF type:complete len:381 (+),score=126.12 TRINITY_DN6311_c0_g1_i1:405-1547(+)